tara:strand:+ start:8025 stop:8300 length:276 start_codon:yes stop_codon:yes gene_type:complete
MTVNNSRTDSTGGIYEGTQYGDKTFYGFRLNNLTGDLTVEVIDANDDTPIKIPDNIYPITDPNDYKQWFWSIDAIEFDIDNKGHIRMKFLS